MTTVGALLWTLLVLVTSSLAGSVNRTIDDEHGDSVTGAMPTYLPGNMWQQGSTCGPCGINISNTDSTQIHDGTWHDSSFFYLNGGDPHTMTVTFTGTAVYVFNMVANSFPPTNTYTNLTFYLDDEVPREYLHVPDDTKTIMYNVLVYHMTGLTNSPHTLRMSSSSTTIPGILVLFDYIVYTVEDGDSPASVKSVSTSSSQATLSEPSDSTSLRPSLTDTSTMPTSSSIPSESSSTPTGSHAPSVSSTGASASLTSTQTSSRTLLSTPSSNPDSMQSSSASPLGLILGLTGSGIAVIILVVGLLCMRARRRHRVTAQARAESSAKDGFVIDSRSMLELRTGDEFYGESLLSPSTLGYLTHSESATLAGDLSRAAATAGMPDRSEAPQAGSLAARRWASDKRFEPVGDEDSISEQKAAQLYDLPHRPR